METAQKDIELALLLRREKDFSLRLANTRQRIAELLSQHFVNQKVGVNQYGPAKRLTE